MKLTISAIALVDAISVIDLVPARAGVTPSEFIQVEKKKNKLYFSLASEVYGTVYAKAITQEDGDWIFHLDRTSLVPFIMVAQKIINAPDFNFSLEEKKKAKVLIIKSGRRKVIFNQISFIAGYPTYTSEKGITIPLDTRQRRLLQLGACYATSDPTLEYVNCVQIKKDTAILASNRVILFYGENKTIPLSLPLPLLLLKLIDEEAVKSVALSKEIIKLVFKQGFISQAINEVARTDFPTKQLMTQFKSGKSYKTQFKLKATSFLKAIERLEIYIRGVVSRELLVNLKCDKGSTKLLLYCDTPQGRFSETVTLSSEARIDIQCEWMLAALTPLIMHAKKLGTLQVKFDKDTPYHISSDDKIEVVISKRS
jgi:hypothetical protein